MILNALKSRVIEIATNTNETVEKHYILFANY